MKILNFRHFYISVITNTWEYSADIFLQLRPSYFSYWKLDIDIYSPETASDFVVNVGSESHPELFSILLYTVNNERITKVCIMSKCSETRGEKLIRITLEKTLDIFTFYQYKQKLITEEVFVIGNLQHLNLQTPKAVDEPDDENIGKVLAYRFSEEYASMISNITTESTVEPISSITTHHHHTESATVKTTTLTTQAESTVVCSPGTYKNDSECSNCPINHHCPNSDMLEPKQCPAEHYQPIIGQTDCIKIETTCIAGKYLLGQHCENCPIGHFCKQNNAKVCPIGTFQPEKGKGGCKMCRYGKKCSNEKSMLCMFGRQCQDGEQRPMNRNENHFPQQNNNNIFRTAKLVGVYSGAERTV